MMMPKPKAHREPRDIEKQGPPTYEKRIDMIKAWCRQLGLIDKEQRQLTAFGENLLRHPMLIRKKYDLEIVILAPEADVLRAIFSSLPSDLNGKGVVNDVSRNDYFMIAANTYGLKLDSEYACSDEQLLNDVKDAYRIFKHGAFKQVSLDAIKEILDIRSALTKDTVTRDFFARIKQLRDAYPHEISLLSSPFGLGYIFLKREAGSA